jgi:hypothetical protein
MVAPRNLQGQVACAQETRLPRSSLAVRATGPAIGGAFGPIISTRVQLGKGVWCLEVIGKRSWSE